MKSTFCLQCFVLIIGLLFCESDILAQKIDFQLTHVDLSISGIIEDFEEDTLGHLWIGSTNGLYRYNGIESEKFSHNPRNDRSIGQNYITNIIRDKGGKMWMSTFGTGIARYDETVNMFTRIPLDHVSNSNTRACRTIVSTSDSVLWTSSYYGLNRIDVSDLSHQHYLHKDGDPKENFLDEIKLIDDQHLLIFPRGLTPYLFNIFTTSFSEFSDSNHYLRKIINSESQVFISESTEDTWVANCSEIIHLKGDSIIRKRDLNYYNSYPNKGCISDLLVAKNSEDIWMIVDDELYYFDNDHLYELNQIVNLPIESLQRPYLLFEDKNATIWIACENGIFKIERNRSSFQSIQIPGFTNQEAYGITAISDQEVAISGWNGLYSYNFENNIFRQLLMPKKVIEETRGIAALHFMLRPDGSLWAPMRNYGLLEFKLLEDNKRWQFQNVYNSENSGLSSDDLISLEEDKYGALWIGNFRSGIDVKTIQNEWYHYTSMPEDSLSLSSNSISKILRDQNGGMWISTYGGGLNKYIPGNDDFYAGHFERILPSNSDLSHGVIPYIHEDSQGYIWIATYSGGLNKFDPRTAHFELFTEDNGLPSNLIFSITPDLNRQLWLATDQGLASFDPIQKRIQSFDQRDGLITEEFWYNANELLPDGSIMLGTKKGIIRFHPDSLNQKISDVKLINSNFLLDNKLLEIHNDDILTQTLLFTKKIQLDYTQTNIGFEYHVIDTRNPGSYQYAYKLEGFDQDWKDIGTKTVVNYTNIDPGNYKWMVKARKRAGDWALFTKPIDITITPPWWQTPWAYFIYLLFLVSTIIFVYRYQRNKWELHMELALHEEKMILLRKEKETEKLNAMLHSIENERQRIAKDLHDSMGSILSRIYSNYQFIINRLSNPEVNKVILETDEMINKASSEIRRIAHDMMPTSLVRLGLKNALKDLMVPLQRNGISTSLEVMELPDDFNSDVSLNLYRIIQELLNNALKHAHAKNIWVQLSFHSDEIQLFVEDDGIGLDIGLISEKTGIGLETVQSRVSYLNGSLDILSEINEGSTFTIHIPYPVKTIQQ